MAAWATSIPTGGNKEASRTRLSTPSGTTKERPAKSLSVDLDAPSTDLQPRAHNDLTNLGNSTM